MLERAQRPEATGRVSAQLDLWRLDSRSVPQRAIGADNCRGRNCSARKPMADDGPVHCARLNHAPVGHLKTSARAQPQGQKPGK